MTANQSPPARPDGDALKPVRELLRRVRSGSIDAETEILEMMAARAHSPARDAAEGGDDQDPPMKWLISSLRDLARDLLADPKTPWIGDRDPKQHICWTAADRLESAPPKPAPDAVREALEALEPFANIGLDVLKNRAGWANEVFEGKWCDTYPLKYTDFERAAAVAIALRLSEPVPPADGALAVMNEALARQYGIPDELWKGATKDNPMVPSATGAAEPVAWRWQHVNDRREPRPWHYEDAPWHGNEYMQAQPLYATPPVRGDREADVPHFMETVRSRWNFEETEFDAIENVISDPKCVAALSLPVQPGAGERS